MQIKNLKSKEVSVISVCVSKNKKLTLLTDTVTARNGFSLIEVIMIIVIVAVAIPTLLIIVGQEAKQGVEPELRVTATNVGQQLLEEIRTKCWDANLISGGVCGAATMISYSNIGEDSEGTCGSLPCNNYDDIDDYASGAISVPVGGISYSASVEVCYVSDSDLKTTSCVTSGSSGTNYKRVAVTVAAPSSSWGSSVALTTVMTNY